MNKTIYETLYWLVQNTKVELDKVDSKQTILHNLGMIIISPVSSDKTLEKIKKSLDEGSEKEASTQ